MSTLQENALIVLRVMSDLGAVGKNFRSVPEIFPLAQLDNEDFLQADQYLLDSGYINGSFVGRIGRRWLTERGVEHLEKSLAGRMSLSLTAERILRQLVESGPNKRHSLRHSHILYSLNLEWDDYKRACQQLETHGLMENRVSDPYKVIAATEEGIEAVLRDFRNLQAPSAQLQAGEPSTSPEAASEPAAVETTVAVEPGPAGEMPDPKDIMSAVERLLEELISTAADPLTIEQKAVYLKYAAAFKAEMSQANPDPGRLHQLLNTLSFFGDLDGTMQTGRQTLELAARISPAVTELTRLVLQLLDVGPEDS